MSSACLNPARLTAFLVGDLDPDEDRAVAEHLEQCSACERMAAEFSDDLEARELAAAAEGKTAAAGNEPQVEDLCRRLHALGLYELAVQAEEDDTDAGRAAGPRRTAVFRARLRPQTALDVNAANLGPPGASQTEEPPPLSPRLKRLGRYEIVRALGAGSFGVVYLAHDYKLDRPVALKIARPSVLADDHLRLRFIREAVTLAKLQHPHIVPVYEADEVEGICYLAIAFCDGPTLDQWLRDQGGRIDPRLAVRLLLPLVDAVQHAHANGVLHRDIKPANVILQKADGKDSELPLVPRLTDFGLAKIVEEPSSSTLSGIVLGTAQYMAPEQAAGHIERIGAPTDVYALGAVLYQMLAGRPPIEGKTNLDTLRRLLIDEPVEIRRLIRGMPADLDAIVLRCLHKTVGERYPSAADLATDLRRFLVGQTTLARPLKLQQRAGRWLAKNPTLTGLIALSVLVVGLSIGLYISAQQLLDSHERHNRAESLAKQQLAEYERTVRLRDYANDIRSAGQGEDEGDMAAVLAALRRQIPSDKKVDDLRGLEWHYLWNLATQKPLAEVNVETQAYQIRLSPNGREIAAACKDAVLRIFDARDFGLLASIPTGQKEINGVAYSPDGRLIATAGDDCTVRLFDTDTRRERPALRGHQNKVFGVAFFDSGRKLVSCGEETLVRVWDVASAKPAGELHGHKRAVEALAISPDGSLLATVSSDQTCILWDLTTLKQLFALGEHTGRLSSVAFSPDGQRLAIGCLNNTVSLWDLKDRRRLADATHHDGVQSVSFCTHGRCLFAGDRSGSLRKYEILEGTAANPHHKLVAPQSADNWQAHEGRVWCAIPGSDPGKLITSGADGRLRIWATSPQEQVRQVLPPNPDDHVVDMAFGADEELFILRETSGIDVLDAGTLRLMKRWALKRDRWTALEVLAGRDEVAAGTSDGRVVVWNSKNGQARPLIDLADSKAKIASLLYSPPTGLIAVLPFGANDVRLYRAASGEFLCRLPTNNHASAAISPDGKRLAVDSLNNIFVYDIQSQRVIHTLSGHVATIFGLAFRPQGDLLASASSDRTLRLWTRGGQEREFTVRHHRAPLVDTAFTPDGKTLVSIDDAGKLRLTNPDADRILLDIPTDTKVLRALAVAPDSRRLAVLREDYSVLLIGRREQLPPQQRSDPPR